MGNERRDLTTVVGRDYSTIALTVKRVANRLNARGFEATSRRENPSGTSPDATKERFQSSLCSAAVQLLCDVRTPGTQPATHNSSLPGRHGRQEGAARKGGLCHSKSRVSTKFALRSSNMRLILGKQDVDSDATSEISPYRSHLKQSGFAMDCFYTPGLF